jgi:cellulose synthase/poly-beta-1,6-N-acetylglucosamine synthase-like glycosyltransferase
MNEFTEKLAVQRTENSSARIVVSREQLVFAVVLLMGLLLGLVLGATVLSYVITIVAILTLCYLGLVVFNLYLILNGTADGARVTMEMHTNLRAESGLPLYSIMVPLYKESSVLPHLVHNLMALDYPVDKLEIFLLMEADDQAMLQAVKTIRLPAHFQVIEVPVSHPRTKPKALNYGLQFVHGDYCVVYDAEDQPEPDQLLKAVAAFRHLPLKVVCLQAMLAYHNPAHNLLTRFFASEYSSWFGFYIPGMAKRNLLMLLGGTSNHFRTNALVKLGGWDPYNVTEDADLGIRLARAGYFIRVLDSTTWEEANARPWSWVKQRSRWIKGYLQTYLAHMRDPIQLYKELGLGRFVTFQFMVGISPLTNIMNPVFWTLTAIYLLTRAPWIEVLYPGWMLYLGSLSLFVGNYFGLAVSLSGALRQNQYTSMMIMLFTPLYWLLMSVAGWRAFWQLIVNPHYWDKTQHGVDATPVTTLPPVTGWLADEADLETATVTKPRRVSISE